RPAAPGEVPAPIQAIGGFLGGVFGAAGDKPMIDSLKPGPYSKANEAIGEAPDLAEMQVSRGGAPFVAFTACATGAVERSKADSGQSGVAGRVYVLASGEPDAGATAGGTVHLSAA